MRERLDETNRWRQAGLSLANENYDITVIGCSNDSSYYSWHAIFRHFLNIPLMLYLSFTSALQPFQICPLWCDTTWKGAQQHATATASALVFDMQSHKSIPSYITFWLEARFQLTEACDGALMALTHIFPLFLPLNHCWDSPIAPAPLCPFTPLSSHVGQPDLGGSGYSVMCPGRANDTQGE